MLAGVGALTAPALGTGAWHRVAATWDGYTMQIYVDGASVARTSASGAIATTTTPLVIGG